MPKCTSARGTGKPPPVCGLHVWAAQRSHWHPSRMGRRHQVVIHRAICRRRNTVYPRTFLHNCPLCTLVKKKTKFSSYIRKFRWEQLQVIYEEMRKYLTIYEEAVSYIWIFKPIPSEFLHIWGKFDFLFYQCMYFFWLGKCFTKQRYPWISR